MDEKQQEMIRPPEDENGCACRIKRRLPEEFQVLINRINRIEGQVRGVRRMIEEDAYCVDILTQVSAIRSALASFSSVLLGNHIQTCVAEDIRDGGTEKMEELVSVLHRFMK